ncbi:SigE family RNA polymerase sigma factor [Catenulispora subtropica]|uniref:SigE family RNA polymerase sigma factor n=1 Tax=Catenulispora subtropica TaxID=450798 RepID=UPI0031CE4263
MTTTADDDFRDFMAARWPALVRTAYLLTGSHHGAEDLAQTALVRAFVKWQRVRASDDPGAYVRQIMVHCHADQFRRRRVAEWLTSRLPEPPASPAEPSGEEAEVLLAALGRLPARQRAVVVLYYFDDMTHAEIAAALGSREGTVRSQLSRAMARLRGDGLLAQLTGRTQPVDSPRSASTSASTSTSTSASTFASALAPITGEKAS